jgi:hypothetical protein
MSQMRWTTALGRAMVVLTLLMTVAALRPAAADAQAPETSVTTRDPAGITFAVRSSMPSGLKSARLEYFVANPDGNVGGGGDGTIAGGDASFTLQTNGNQRYIPVGSVLKYYWVLTPNEGAQITTPEQDYLFLDGRFTWKSRSDGPVTVWWYGNADAKALTALNAAKASLEQTGALLEANVTYPIRLVVYVSEDEGRPAKRPTSPTFDAQIQTGGQRVAPDLVFVFANDVDVVRHEVAHIVTHLAGDGPAPMPAWLDEGVAVYSQTQPGFGYTSGVQGAIATDRAFSLRSINSPTGNPNLVNVFYGQSWSTVKYLVDTHGQAKFAELFRVLKAGARIDDGLMRVYGFNQDGLYNAWREKNGLKPVAVTQIEVPGAAAAQATRAPLGVPSGGLTSGATMEAGGGGTASSGSDGAEASNGDSSRTAAIAVLGVTLLLAVALGGGGFYLLRSKRGEA